MPSVRDLAQFMFGRDGGFWYAHPLGEIKDLTEEQLFAVPQEEALCILWQVGHIAHRERAHIAHICGGPGGEGTPFEYEAFGDNWINAEELRGAVEVDKVCDWVREVRQTSLDFIASLTDEEMDAVTGDPEDGLTAAHWLMITAAHGALHIGRIQALRAWLEGNEERAC